VDSSRVALAYDRTNDLYQLNLARALRDTGRTDESRSYLLSLWERKPEDSTINLARTRLAARQNSIEDALRFYHNASYGVWPADGDSKRRAAQFELIEFLLRDKALPQAQAELITMTPALPSDSGFHLRLGKLFAGVQDYQPALAQFEQVLRLDHENSAALAGAGESSFKLGRFRSAEGYLSLAVKANSGDAQSRQWLQETNLILQTDPYARRISNAERQRREREAFEYSGRRLDTCMASKGISLTTPWSAGIWVP
jgi:tetratricopeptide (TPR) repeat protein